MSSVDRYEIQGEIGRGESSVVYRARDRLTDRLVAIKAFQQPANQNGTIEALAGRLDREAQLLSRVRHSSIVEVIEARFSCEGAWLVTEYVEGESLQELLRRRERLQVEEAIAFAAQAARALAWAHRNGVVHRDVKPANLLVTAEGTLKVTDFGVAGETGARAGSTQDVGYFLGTPAYVAPEQWCGDPVDGRADIYSLGVVLYRCLSGCRPFEGRTVREVVYRALHDEPSPPSSKGVPLPPELDRVCLKALARIPGERYPDGESFARALEAVVITTQDSGSDRPATGWSDDPMEKTWQRLPVTRGTFARIGRVSLLLAASVFIILGAMGWNRPQAEADVPAEHGIDVRTVDESSGADEGVVLVQEPELPVGSANPDPVLLERYSKIGSRSLRRKPQR